MTRLVAAAAVTAALLLSAAPASALCADLRQYGYDVVVCTMQTP